MLDQGLNHAWDSQSIKLGHMAPAFRNSPPGLLTESADLLDISFSSVGLQWQSLLDNENREHTAGPHNTGTAGKERVLPDKSCWLQATMELVSPA